MNIARIETEQGAEWSSSLAVSRAPEIVLAEAQDAAAALKRVIDAKPKKVQFGGETYLEFEDWQTVGRFYGIAPRIARTQYVNYGGATGWEATAEAVHVETGKVVSSADSMCLTDEEHWRARPKYEWHYVKKSGGTSAVDPGKDELIWERGNDGKNRPKKLKVQMADEPVPLFQLRSMAQTRAAAKALRNALAWVVVLAGYRPTPAEEMDGMIEGARRVAIPDAGAASPTGVGAPDGPRAPAPAQPMTAEQLFETPGEEATRKVQESATLLSAVQGRWDALKTPAALRVKMWERIVGSAPYLSPDADPAVLADLLRELGA